MRFTLCAASLGTLLLGGCSPRTSNELTMLVGTYTSGTSKGIYSFRFDQETGKATPLSLVEVADPSFLTPSADGKFVYAVSEQDDEHAVVTAFAFDKRDGTFRTLGSQKTGGDSPCYIVTNGNYVVTANYGGGSISALPINTDGSLLPATAIIQFAGSGPNQERQTKPYLHCVRIAPDGKYLFGDDLGTDRIHKFELDVRANAANGLPLLKEGTPKAYTVAAGSGPRHLTFAPDGSHAYLINELAGTVIAFDYTDGNLVERQTILADTLKAGGSADIHVSPDGRFLYASNRLKGDGIAIFSVDPTDGTLARVGYQPTGIHPRNFAITPNGKYLLVACRDSQVIQVFGRDAATGLLTEKAGAGIAMDKPVCIRFVP